MSIQQQPGKVRAFVGVSAQSCLALCHPMDCIASQAPLSTGFSRPEYWSGLPCPHPGDLPDQGTEGFAPPALAGRLFTTAPPGEIQSNGLICWDLTLFYKFACVCLVLALQTRWLTVGVWRTYHLTS